MSNDTIATMTDAYKNFDKVLKNRPIDTEKTYKAHILFYMKTEGFVNHDQLLDGTAKQIQERIKNILTQLSYAKANKLVAALQMFYDSNDVIINWDHVRLFKPKKPERERTERPYNIDEMLIFYKYADLREQVLELMMGTGMPRIGAMPDIRIERDLCWIEEYKLYASLIYPLSDERYITFFSPQASKHIDELKGKRDKGYLFVNKRESDLPVKKGSLQSAVWEILVKSGLREPGNKTQRHTVQMDHGFRKFGRTQLGNAGVLKDHAEALEGHIPQLVRVYDIPTAIEYLKRTEYFKAIPYLTLPL